MNLNFLWCLNVHKELSEMKYHQCIERISCHTEHDIHAFVRHRIHIADFHERRGRLCDAGDSPSNTALLANGAVTLIAASILDNVNLELL